MTEQSIQEQIFHAFTCLRFPCHRQSFPDASASIDAYERDDRYHRTLSSPEPEYIRHLQHSSLPSCMFPSNDTNAQDEQSRLPVLSILKQGRLLLLSILKQGRLLVLPILKQSRLLIFSNYTLHMPN